MDETTANLKNQTDVLRAEIERARYETVQTMSELQRRLSMDNVKSRTRQSIRDATVGKAQVMRRKATDRTKDWSTTVYRTVRHNPIPMVMVGTGIAWLIRKRGDGRSKEGYGEHEKYAPAYDDQTYEEVGDLDYPYARRYYETMGSETAAEYQERDRREKLQSKVEEGRGKVQTTAENLKRRASDISESARSRAEQWGEKARDTSGRLRTTASDLSHRARERSSQAKRGFLDSLDSNPLAVAGVLFAVGAAIGLLAPRTQKEQEVLGPARDKLAERAREAGREQVEKARSVAHEAKEAALNEAQRQDLISRETAGKVEEKSSAAMQQAEEKSRQTMERTQAEMERVKQEGISKTRGPVKKS